MKRYVADFETTTQIDDCRVWAYATCEIGNTENVEVGNSIDKFMKWCEKDNKIVYFHNEKFDGEFIIYWLFHHGFEWSKDKLSKTFNTIISGAGQFYAIEIIFEKKNKEYRKVTIYDSLKKLPYTVDKIAKDFHLPIQKLEIDYSAYRPVGYELTQQEVDYVINDVKIVAMALEIQINQGLTKMTNGSDALNDFKMLVGKKNFTNIFPILDMASDDFIRLGYRGGWTYVNPKYQGKDVGVGMVYDVNSLYPSRMYKCPLPYGLPIFYEGRYEHDDEYPLYIQHIRCEFKIKKGHLPMIQIKHSRFRDTEYLTESNGEVDLVLCNVDLELFFEHYDVPEYSLDYVRGCKFHSCIGVFNDYIDKWMAIKTTSEGAVKQLAKLMLNSLYGKFATNPDVTGKHPELKEDDTVHYVMNDMELREPVYTAVGVFITAYGRDMTIRTAQKVYDRFLYADTDSIHLLGDDVPEVIKDVIDDKKLGYWAHESTFTRARFIRQKTYIEEVNGKLDVKCAGMPNKVKEVVTWDNFHVGFKSKGKLLPKHVKGGIVLCDTEFTLKG